MRKRAEIDNNGYFEIVTSDHPKALFIPGADPASPSLLGQLKCLGKKFGEGPHPEAGIRGVSLRPRLIGCLPQVLPLFVA